MGVVFIKWAWLGNLSVTNPSVMVCLANCYCVNYDLHRYIIHEVPPLRRLRLVYTSEVNMQECYLQLTANVLLVLLYCTDLCLIDDVMSYEYN